MQYAFPVLEEMVRFGRLAEIEAIRQQEPDALMARDQDGNSLLHVAADFSPKVIRVLIESGISPNVQNDLGYTPLHAAVMAENADSVAELLSAKPSLQVSDASGRTCLFLAKQAGHESIFEQLIAAGAQTDLLTAAIDGQVGQMTELLSSQPKSKLSLALCLACAHGDKEGALLLIDAGAPINEPAAFDIPLICAAIANNQSLVSALLERGADANIRDRNGWSALTYAADKRNLGMISLLELHGADCELVDAVLLNRPDYIRMRMKEDPGSLTNKNAEERSLLHYAAIYDRAELLSLLLNTGCRDTIDDADITGSTAIYLASLAGHRECASLLLEAGASPLMQDGWDGPVHAAAREGHVDVVEALLEAAPQLAILPDALGMTPLQIADSNGHYDLSKLLSVFIAAGGL